MKQLPMYQPGVGGEKALKDHVPRIRVKLSTMDLGGEKRIKFVIQGPAVKVSLFTTPPRLIGINFGLDKASKLNSPTGSVFLGRDPGTASRLAREMLVVLRGRQAGLQALTRRRAVIKWGGFDKTPFVALSTSPPPSFTFSSWFFWRVSGPDRQPLERRWRVDARYICSLCSPLQAPWTKTTVLIPGRGSWTSSLTIQAHIESGSVLLGGERGRVFLCDGKRVQYDYWVNQYLKKYFGVYFKWRTYQEIWFREGEASVKDAQNWR